MLGIVLYEILMVFLLQLLHVKMCSTKLSLSHGSGMPFLGVWAMARDPIFWGVWAMAREHLFWGFEPWLRTPFLGGLSHGSRPINYCIWAMAQEHLFWRCWSCALHCSGKNFRFYLTSLYWVRLGKSMGRRPKSSPQGLAVVHCNAMVRISGSI